MKSLSVVLLAMLLVATPACAFTARVTACHDSDICRVETRQEIFKIGLAEIDAPEID